jgi:hypothetical protein
MPDGRPLTVMRDVTVEGKEAKQGRQVGAKESRRAAIISKRQAGQDSPDPTRP